MPQHRQLILSSVVINKQRRIVKHGLSHVTRSSVFKYVLPAYPPIHYSRNEKPHGVKTMGQLVSDDALERVFRVHVRTLLIENYFADER
jgi:hypothetical protein